MAPAARTGERRARVQNGARKRAAAVRLALAVAAEMQRRVAVAKRQKKQLERAMAAARRAERAEKRAWRALKKARRP